MLTILMGGFMVILLWIFLFWSFESSALDLNDKAIGQLYQNGYILKATIKNKDKILFSKNSTMVRVSNNSLKDQFQLGCFLHLKEKTNEELHLDIREAIVFDGAKELKKEYGQIGRYLHMQFLTSSGHSHIGGIRIGRKDLHNFIWYDSTYTKSVNELNRLCDNLKIEVLPKAYVSSK